MRNKTSITEWVVKEIARQAAKGSDYGSSYLSPEDMINAYLQGESVNMAELADYSIREIIEFCENASLLVSY